MNKYKKRSRLLKEIIFIILLGISGSGFTVTYVVGLTHFINANNIPLLLLGLSGLFCIASPLIPLILEKIRPSILDEIEEELEK